MTFSLEDFTKTLQTKYQRDTNNTPQQDLITTIETDTASIKIIFTSYAFVNPAYTGGDVSSRDYYSVTGYVLVHKK